MQEITPTLWISDDMDEAAEFYCSLFEDSRVTGSNDYGPDAGEYAGKKMVIRLELQGQPYILLYGGETRFTPNESVSFAVGCDSQDEVDRLWAALEQGGEPGPCGWIKDRYGFSWQVTPTRLYEMLDDPDPEKVQRVTAAFMAVDQRKFEISDLEAAFEGRG
jgi:predicted 3-demethylubiquinone-9 3-methyltransferase (glyoxalase superfamily)